MIWFVDIEHPKVLQNPKRAPGHAQYIQVRAAKLAETSGVPCEAIYFTEVSLDLARQRGVQAIAISGNGSDWAEYDFAQFQPLMDIIRGGEIPLIGFCGGGQLIGLANGVECGPMRELRPGETDVMPGYHPGMFKESGFLPIQVVKPDPIWEGLGQSPLLLQGHYWEIKQVPDQYELLASTAECRIQLIRHRKYCVYGTQFHPEGYDNEHLDGRRFLANFFRIAGVLPRA